MTIASSHVTNQDGFSLVEMLVAVFLLSVVSMISLSVMSNFAYANQMVTEKMGDLGKIERARDYFRTDLREAINRGFFVQDPNIDNDGLLFRITRGGAENAKIDDAYSPVEMIEYRIHEKNLIRRSYLRPQATENTPYREYVVLENVADITLKFYDGFLWQDFWINSQNSQAVTLPRALEISWFIVTDNKKDAPEFSVRFPIGRAI